MTTEDWFKKFEALRPGDWVNFDGLRLRVWCIASFGGCVFTHPYGEHFPVSSACWDRATVEGKDTIYMDSSQYREGENEEGEGWKNS